MNNLINPQIFDIKKPAKYKTILIVDENFTWLSSIQKMLVKEDFLTIGFTRSEAAIKSINKHRPDIILLNCSNHNNLALNFIKVLKEKKINLPLIVMVDSLDDNFVTEISRFGTLKILVKNEKFFEVLISKITAILK